MKQVTRFLDGKEHVDITISDWNNQATLRNLKSFDTRGTDNDSPCRAENQSLRRLSHNTTSTKGPHVSVGLVMSSTFAGCLDRKMSLTVPRAPMTLGLQPFVKHDWQPEVLNRHPEFNPSIACDKATRRPGPALCCFLCYQTGLLRTAGEYRGIPRQLFTQTEHR